jgi:oligopeptide transport system substrate-binding protein
MGLALPRRIIVHLVATVVNRTPFSRLLICVVAAALALASCGRRESAVHRGNREQVLERGSHADVSDLDPQTAITITELDVASALFEGLVSENPIDLHPVPAVAETWEASPDGLGYTFHLRESARWSDGSPVTAEDFVRSWQRMLTPSLAAENAGMLYVLEGAEAYHKGVSRDFRHVGAHAIDAHTLRVTLEHPTPYFLSLLTHAAWFPVPVRTIEQHGGLTDRGNRWTRPGSLIGNGPFVLKTWRPNQEILVEKSPTYWDAGRVRLNAIRFHPIDSIDAEERAFRAEQLHVTYEVPLGKAEGYRRESPQFIRSDPYLNTYFLRLNTTRPPLDDERVRRALSLAIDREALVGKVLRNGQRAATSITPPGMARYNPPAVVRTDIDEARRLLAESKYSAGGTPLKLELLFNTNETLRVVAEALQQMWHRELGIDVELTNQEYKVVLSERAAGRYQMLISDWVGDYLDANTFLEPWRSDSANNHTGWTNGEYDALLFAAARNPDATARAEQLRHAESLLLNAAPIIPLYYNAHTFLLQPSVKGWHPTLLDHHPYKYVWLEP